MKYFLLVPLLFLFLTVYICYAQTNVIKSTNIPRSNNSASTIINNRVHNIRESQMATLYKNLWNLKNKKLMLEVNNTNYYILIFKTKYILQEMPNLYYII